MKVKKTKKLDPKKLWSDCFIDEGEFSISFDKTGQFDSRCEVIKYFQCVKAYFDKDKKLHLILDEK